MKLYNRLIIYISSLWVFSLWIYSFDQNILDEIHKKHKIILERWKLEYTKIIKRKKWQRWYLKKDKWLNLLERLEKKENSVLWFLDDFSIPFDNNLAERDLRMVKTRTKISGCFRSEEWINRHNAILSFIETMKKQDRDILSSLKQAIQWKFFFCLD